MRAEAIVTYRLFSFSLVATLVAACGGSVGTTSGDANGAGRTDGTTSTSTLVSTNPSCAASIPTAGSVCPGKMFGYCEYGASEATDCNTIVQCVSRGSSCSGAADCERALADRVWSVVPPLADKCAASKSATTDGVPTRPPRCPSTRPFLGTACSGDLSCVYSCQWPSFVCVDGFWSEGVGSCPQPQEPDLPPGK